MPRTLEQWANRYVQAWQPDVSPEQAAVFRILAAAAFLALWLVRLNFLPEMYFDSGILPHENLHLLYPIRPPYYFFPIQDWAVRAFYAAGVASTLGLLLFGGRLLAAATLFFHYCFSVRNIMLLTEFEYILCCWLIALCFIDSSKAYSAKTWLLRSRRSLGELDWLSKYGVRLVQLQICIMYYYSGIDKLREKPWWTLSAFSSGWDSPQYAYFNPYGAGQLLRHIPLLPSLLVLTVLLFEIYFPMGVWFKKSRLIFLWLGVFVHLVIASILEMFFVNIAMLSAYVLFLKPDEFSKLKSWLGTPIIRFSRVS